MFRGFGRLTALPMLVVALSACNGMRSSTDLLTKRMDEAKASYGRHLTYMVDNAILNDMSVADAHFVLHTSELNGIGAARLDRMARLLNTYGGRVRYETTSNDEAMVGERIQHVREYLALAGCKMDRVEVSVGRAGGHGMPGREAVRKYLESTSEPEANTTGTNPSGALGISDLTDN